MALSKKEVKLLTSEATPEPEDSVSKKSKNAKGKQSERSLEWHDEAGQDSERKKPKKKKQQNTITDGVELQQGLLTSRATPKSRSRSLSPEV